MAPVSPSHNSGIKSLTLQKTDPYKEDTHPSIKTYPTTAPRLGEKIKNASYSERDHKEKDVPSKKIEEVKCVHEHFENGIVFPKILSFDKITLFYNAKLYGHDWHSGILNFLQKRLQTEGLAFRGGERQADHSRGKEDATGEP